MRLPQIGLLMWLMIVGGTALAQQVAHEQTPPPIRCIAFSPDGQTLAASTSERGARGELAMWNCSDWQLRFHYSEPIGFPRFAYSPDGEQLALARMAPELKLLNAHTGEVLSQLVGHQVNARCVCFTEKGQKIITGSDDKTIKIWDAQSYALVRTLPEHFAGIADIAVSPNGERLISADVPQSYKAHVWDLKSGTIAYSIERFDSIVVQVSYSTDGNFISIASWGGDPQLCHADTGEVFRSISGVGSGHWVVLSPDQRWLAVATGGEDVLVLDGMANADESTNARMVELLKQLESDSYQEREAATREFFSLGGVVFPLLREAQGSKSPEVRWRARRLLQRMDRLQAAKILKGHQAELNSLSFSPDSQLLASGDTYGVVKVWHVGDWAEVTTLTMPFKPTE
jgi:WD40 repeat protein